MGISPQSNLACMSISLRLPESMIDELSHLANERDVPYHCPFAEIFVEISNFKTNTYGGFLHKEPVFGRLFFEGLVSRIGSGRELFASFTAISANN
jgi:hypothetical protein